MANQRREGQSFVGFQGDERLLGTLERARLSLRKDRSLFIREALAEKLKAMGYDIPDDWVMPPMRGNVMLNEDTQTSGELPERNPNVKYTAKKQARKKT